MKIAADLQHVPAEYVLSSAYEYQRFNPQVIQAVLDQLTLDNARIFYIDKQQTGEQDMEYFAGQYSVNDINSELEQTWQLMSEQFAPKPTAQTCSWEMARTHYLGWVLGVIRGGPHT